MKIMVKIKIYGMDNYISRSIEIIFRCLNTKNNTVLYKQNIEN